MIFHSILLTKFVFEITMLNLISLSLHSFYYITFYVLKFVAYKCTYIHILLWKYQGECNSWSPCSFGSYTIAAKTDCNEVHVLWHNVLRHNHMNKVIQCKKIECRGVHRIYKAWSWEAFTCWVKSRMRIRACSLSLSKNRSNPKTQE